MGTARTAAKTLRPLTACNIRVADGSVGWISRRRNPPRDCLRIETLVGYGFA